MTKEQIHKFCEKYNIKKYSINEDLSIDVYTNVNITRMELTELPLNFNIVHGYFNCNLNKLTSLKGSPILCRDFHCASNNLESIEYLPILINGDLDISYNMLINLNYIGTIIGNIYLFNNPLISLHGYNGDYNKLKHHHIKKLIRKDKFKKIKKLLDI